MKKFIRIISLFMSFLLVFETAVITSIESLAMENTETNTIEVIEDSEIEIDESISRDSIDINLEQKEELQTESVEIEEEQEDIKLASVGNFTGKEVVMLGSTRCNVTDTKINYLKKSYVNTSTKETIEIMNSVERCGRIEAKYSIIGSHAFAGKNNANPTYRSTVETRLNKNLYEIDFESGSKLEKIEGYAFSNLDAFAAFNGSNATELAEIGDGVFWEDRNLSDILLPANVSSFGKDTFVTNNPYTKIITIENSVTDKTLQGSYVFNLPGNTYYVYSGVDPARYVQKTFALNIEADKCDYTVKVDGKERVAFGDIPCGAKVVISVNPKEGYYFSDIPRTNMTQDANHYSCKETSNGYEISFVMTMESSIKQETKIQTHTLNINTKGMGATKVEQGGNSINISASKWSKVFDYGTQLSIKFSPANHYHIESVMVDNVNKGKISAISIDMKKDYNVEIAYAIDTFELNLLYDTQKGQITGNKKVYNYGDKVNLLIEPKEGYEIDEIYVNAKKQNITDIISFTIEQDSSIQVSFKKKTYQITTEGNNVSISNDSAGVYEHGKDVTFYFSPVTGYQINKILVDDKEIGTGAVYTFVNLNSNHKILVISSPIEYEISVTGEHVTFLNDCEDKFIHGSNPSFSFEVEDGYFITDVLVDGISVGARDSYSFRSLDRNHKIILKTEKKQSSGAIGENPGGAPSGTVSGNGGTVSGNGTGDSGSGNVSGNGTGNSNGNISGNETGDGNGNGGNASGNISGDGSGNGGNVSGNGAGDGSNGNINGAGGSSNYNPDKTGYDVDDDGNPVNKSNNVIRVEFNTSGGYLKDNYILFHSGSGFRLPIPIREGYDFAGWYIGGNRIESTKAIHSAMDSIVARWTPAIYRITYDLAGGMFKNASKVPYLYTISKSTSLAKPIRPGYVFAGWYMKGSDIRITKLKKGYYYGGTLDLEARWYQKNASSYRIENKDAKTGGKITYQLNGGYFKDLSKVSDYYAFMTSTALQKPVRTGYKFEGWYIAGTEVKLTRISKNQYLGDVTLVAKWSRSHYAITYIKNKGKGQQDKTTLVYDQSGIIRNCNYMRAGYVFTGWNTKANGTGIPYKMGDDVKNLTTKSNIKLYAQWQRLY